MSKFYVGDLGTAVLVDVGTDITGATNPKLFVTKPTSGEELWTVSVYTDPITGLTQYLRHNTSGESFTEPGIYSAQPKLTHTGWTGRGETDTFEVHNHGE